MDEKNIRNQTPEEDTTKSGGQGGGSGSTAQVDTKQTTSPDETKAPIFKKIDKGIAFGKAHKTELVYMGIGAVAGFIFGMRYGSRSVVALPNGTTAMNARPYTGSYRYSQPSAGLVEQIALGLMKEALK